MFFHVAHGLICPLVCLVPLVASWHLFLYTSFAQHHQSDCPTYTFHLPLSQLAFLLTMRIIHSPSVCVRALWPSFPSAQLPSEAG